MRTKLREIADLIFFYKDRADTKEKEELIKFLEFELSILRFEFESQKKKEVKN